MGGNVIWRWATHYDGARLGGSAPTKQEAADAATEAWPRMIAQVEAAAAEQAHGKWIEGIAATAERTGELPGVDLPSAEYQDLIKINWHLGKAFEQRFRKQDTTALDRAMSAVSAELFRRRAG